MNIGQRLRDLREVKQLSQGDIEKHTGLLRCYVFRVEYGHTAPNLATLEKWAKALDLEFYQLFFTGKGEPTSPRVSEFPPPTTHEGKLLDLFKEMPAPDRDLLLGVAREIR